MHGSFFVTGVLFWLQVIPSYPLRARLLPVHQAGMLIATDGVMIFLAMFMSLFSKVPWHPVYNHLPADARRLLWPILPTGPWPRAGAAEFGWSSSGVSLGKPPQVGRWL